jgi:hypothetical protein
MAEMRPSRTARVDPNRPFKVAGANVGYGIAKQSFECPDQLGSLEPQAAVPGAAMVWTNRRMRQVEAIPPWSFLSRLIRCLQ